MDPSLLSSLTRRFLQDEQIPSFWLAVALSILPHLLHRTATLGLISDLHCSKGNKGRAWCFAVVGAVKRENHAPARFG